MTKKIYGKNGEKTCYLTSIPCILLSVEVSFLHRNDCLKKIGGRRLRKGTDVMILKNIFAQKNRRKNWRFTQNKAKLFIIYYLLF
jgi:hypothetical protein